jgi:multicomponent Na+:H+ antiporter subunit B
VISLILRTATRFLMPVLLLFSLFLLLRGHNEPGGGFAGGLVAAAAFALHSIAYNAAATRQALRLHPQTLIGTGLLLAAGSGTLSLLLGQSFMTGQWRHLDLPETGTVALGTPMVFDIGVYLVVMGVTLLIILSLSEE